MSEVREQIKMVNLEELSAKELYELAKKKEQEEALQEQLLGRINEIKATREQVKITYQEVLKDIDQQLEELGKQRQTVVADHKKELEELNHELEQLIQEVEESQEALAEASSAEKEAAQRKEQDEAAEAAASKAAEAKPAPPPEKPAAAKPAEKPAPQPAASAKSPAKGPLSKEEELDLLMEHMVTFMKGRAYISESLLREKLQVAKFKPATNLNKLLETLVQQARLVRRNGSNYVLGRVKKK
jgi:DNA repair exonuclease SbcCD ATPase subunit